LNTAELARSLDHTTVEGLAEAIMIAITGLKDREGKYVRVHIGENFEDHIEFSIQIAETLLGKKRTT
jgi:hypothetical protein